MIRHYHIRPRIVWYRVIHAPPRRHLWLAVEWIGGIAIDDKIIGWAVTIGNRCLEIRWLLPCLNSHSMRPDRSTP